MRESLKDYIQRKERERMGSKKYGEKILKEFKEEMKQIYKRK